MRSFVRSRPAAWTVSKMRGKRARMSLPAPPRGQEDGARRHGERRSGRLVDREDPVAATVLDPEARRERLLQIAYVREGRRLLEEGAEDLASGRVAPGVKHAILAVGSFAREGWA